MEQSQDYIIYIYIYIYNIYIMCVVKTDYIQTSSTKYTIIYLNSMHPEVKTQFWAWQEAKIFNKKLNKKH